MKYSVITLTFACTLFYNGLALSGELSKEQAITLFNNTTFDGYNEKKQKNFKVYSAPNGEHTVVFSNGKVINRFWHINNNGEHCVGKKPKKGRCSTVIDAGNGVYHKITKGTHSHTLSNFRPGNQLE